MDVVISWSDVHKGNRLASGNYGTVYEGTCRGQPVAIKVGLLFHLPIDFGINLNLLQVLHNQELDSEKLDALKKEVDIMRFVLPFPTKCAPSCNFYLFMYFHQTYSINFQPNNRPTR